MDDWTEEDQRAADRANSRWRSFHLGWFHYFNYGWEWRSWALDVCLSPYHVAVQLGPFRCHVMWKEPF